MESVASILAKVLAPAFETNKPEEGDYMGNDGLLMCVKCNKKKQTEITLKLCGEDKPVKVPCACDCKKKEWAEMEIKREKLRIAPLKTHGITDEKYLHYTFDKDDRSNPKVSEECRAYVDNFDEMRKQNIGLLFYGNVGTGKTFLACCIANALIEQGIPVTITNFPKILNKLQDFKSNYRQELFNSVRDSELVVIDDFGVERDTSYASEQIYNIIDTRIRSKKPLIVTTNLTPNDITNPENISQEQVLSRIVEMCVPMKLSGKSRRKEIGYSKYEMFKSIISKSKSDG